MKNVTLILPLNVFNDEVKKYLDECLTSIKSLEECEKNKLIIVGPKDVIASANKCAQTIGCTQNITLLENDETDIFKQINKAVMKCTSKYFSVIEFDDVFKPFWFRVANKYVEEKENVSIFMPIVQMKDIKNNVTLFSNEIAWANGFSDEIGYLNMGGLEVYMDFVLSGAIIKTEDFISVGMLKPSMGIASWYELLLRMAYKNKKLFVIPKCGYVHTVNREDSYFNTQSKTITPEHGQWFIDTAKQEYFFKEDRNRVFGEEDAK